MPKYSRLFVVGLVVANISVKGQGQIVHPKGPLPSAEVATIKRGDAHSQMTQSESLLGGVTARLFIKFAYNFPTRGRIVGGPGWMDTDLYTIDMKFSDADTAAMQKMPTVQRDHQIDLMMQSLLASRFQMKSHFETRELPTYDLVPAKGGAKLTPAKYPMPLGKTATPEYGHPEDLQHGVMIHMGGAVPTDVLKSYSMQELADFLGTMPELGGRTVIDKTGITGIYDLSITASYRFQGGAGEISLFSALPDDLGLKLVASKGPVEVLVIDSIERPSEN